MTSLWQKHCPLVLSARIHHYTEGLPIILLPIKSVNYKLASLLHLWALDRLRNFPSQVAFEDP